MSLIDSSYFEKRLLAIPNLANEAIESDLQDYIDLYEDVYFNGALGIKLKNEFLTGLEAGTIDQIWLDLRDGKEYDVSGVTYQWRGFLNDQKLSPIANYVFGKYHQDHSIINTGIGDVKPNAENSTVVTDRFRRSQVWTEGAKLNRELYHFLNEFSDVYPDWDFNNYVLLEKDNVLGV